MEKVKTMNTPIIIRHDDFDFRMNYTHYVNIHEEFIKADLIETAVIQYTLHMNVNEYDQTLIKYMKETPNWDLQLHGWSHVEYDGMDFNYIVRDLSACMYQSYRLFGKVPTVWYPPWNRISIAMERAASFVGLKVDNESYDIQRFIREASAGTYRGHSVYFHGWKGDEMMAFPEMIKLVKEVNNHESSSI
jgi:peptidoglycan/xylan/chitin deacetylase (PgdA/CDA1 family)